MKLIDKDALVAEINRIMNEQQEICKADAALGKNPDSKNIEVIYQFQQFVKFLDTLEVKEVDLEKEYEDYVVDDPIFGNFIANDTMGMNLAKHFFELGIKAQN